MLSILFTKLPYYVTLMVVIAIVSIPEGLPMVIDMSLAFSMRKMYIDGLLVKEMDAPERMGGIDEICCGKTGTLTEGKMKVASFYC